MIALVNKIMEEKTANNCTRFPHSYISDRIDGLRDESPWLTRSVLNKGIRSFTPIDNNIEEQLVTDNPRKSGNSNCNLDRKTGGRPKVSTDKSKKDLADAAMVVNNEVTAAYLKLKERTKNKKLPNGTLKGLVESISTKIKRPGNCPIPTLKKRHRYIVSFVERSGVN